jgi:hypothetical protein
MRYQRKMRRIEQSAKKTLDILMPLGVVAVKLDRKRSRLNLWFRRTEPEVYISVTIALFQHDNPSLYSLVLRELDSYGDEVLAGTAPEV